MKKELKIPLYANIDDTVYEVVGFNEVENKVRVKNFASGDTFILPINKWIIESFKLGTPTTFDYKGNKISGEIIMKNGVKSISLYPDENYTGAAQRIIPLNLIDVTTSSSLMNKELFKDGGNISSENQEKIAKLEKVVNSDLIPEAIKNKAKAEIEKLKSETKAETTDYKNLEIFEELVKNSNSFQEAFDKVAEIKGIPRETSAYFLDKYNPNRNLSKEETFMIFYNEIKNKTNSKEKSKEETKTFGEIDYEQRQLNKKVYALLDKKLSGKADIGFKLRIVQVIGAALEDANYHSANYDFAKAIDSSITTKEEWYRSKIANPSKEDGSLGREISNLCGWDGEKIVACFDFALKMFGMSKIADVLNKVMTADEEEEEENDEDTITNTYKGLIYKVSKDTYETDDYSSNYVSKYYFSVFEPKTNYTLTYSSNYNSNVEAIASARKFIDSIKINGFYPKALIPTVSITDRNGTLKLPFNTVSDAKEFTLAMISHGFEYTGKPIEEELVKSEPKKDVSTVEIKDSRIGDKNISEISTYIPNREILSVKVKHNGKEIEIKGTDIFDGIYVDDKIIPSTRKPKAEPKMSRTQFEEETFEFEKGGSINKWTKKSDSDIVGGEGYSLEHVYYTYKNAKIYYNKVDKEWILEINNKIIKGYKTLGIAKARAEMMLLDSFEQGGRVLNDYVYKEVFDYIIGGNRPSSIEILKNQVNTKAKKLNASVSELYEEVKDAESSSYDYMEKGGKVNSKELEKIIDTTRSFFESNGVNYGQTDDLGNEIIIEPSTVLPKDSNLPKGSLDGMQILYDKTTKIYEVSEYQAGPDEKDLYIFGEYKSLIPALKSLIKGNSTTGRKPMKIQKFAKGGYVRPAYNMPIAGNYSFKTKDGVGYDFRVAGYERLGDDTDSLYFDDLETTAKNELGSIIIKNSSWKNLANGKTIMATTTKGGNGKLTKIK